MGRHAETTWGSGIPALHPIHTPHILCDSQKYDDYRFNGVRSSLRPEKERNRWQLAQLAGPRNHMRKELIRRKPGPMKPDRHSRTSALKGIALIPFERFQSAPLVYAVARQATRRDYVERPLRNARRSPVTKAAPHSRPSQGTRREIPENRELAVVPWTEFVLESRRTSSFAQGWSACSSTSFPGSNDTTKSYSSRESGPINQPEVAGSPVGRIAIWVPEGRQLFPPK
jgi:hypothetical protein